MDVKNALRSKPGWKLPIFFAAAIALTAFATLLGAGGAQFEPEPLPFDPLSEDEAEQAIETTLGDPQVQRALSERHEVIGAALYTDKARFRDDPEARLANVWIYDYERDTVVFTLVDLRDDVLEDVTLTTDYQPPITTGEITSAGELALEDDRVRKELDTLGPYEELDWTARLWTGDTATACPVHRCALVAFLPDGEYQDEFFVRVNLSLDQVEAIVHPGHDHHHASNLGVDA